MTVTREVEGAPKSVFTCAGVLRAIRIPPAFRSPLITCTGAAAQAAHASVAMRRPDGEQSPH